MRTFCVAPSSPSRCGTKISSHSFASHSCNTVIYIYLRIVDISMKCTPCTHRKYTTTMTLWCASTAICRHVGTGAMKETDKNDYVNLANRRCACVCVCASDKIIALNSSRRKSPGMAIGNQPTESKNRKMNKGVIMKCFTEHCVVRSTYAAHSSFSHVSPSIVAIPHPTDYTRRVLNCDCVCVCDKRA